MATPLALWINGQDVGTLGSATTGAARFEVDVIAPAVLGSGDVSPATAAASAASLGDVATGLAPRVGSRRLDVQLVVRAASPAALSAGVDAVKALVPVGSVVPLRTAHDTSREFLVERSGAFTVETVGPALVATGATVTLSLVTRTPAARSRCLRVVAGTVGERAPVPLGTLAVYPRFAIWAPAGITNPTVTARNASGRAVDAFTLAGSLASGDVVEVDCALAAVNRYTSAAPLVAIDAGAWLSSGGGDFFALDPRDAADGAPVTVDLTCTSGGTGAHLMTYYRPLWD